MFDLNEEIKQAEHALKINKKRIKKKKKRKRKRNTTLVRVNKHWHEALKRDSREQDIPISRFLDKICYHAYRIARTKTGRQSLFGLNDKILMENEALKKLFKHYPHFTNNPENTSPIVFFITAEEMQSFAEMNFDHPLGENQLAKVDRYIREDCHAEHTLNETLARVIELLEKGKEPEEAKIVNTE